ncbi:MAG: 2-C-methyl-D-erythritol 4-phosphate cytidylyltransferase [Candidatus Baltobacteraceae bacterium]
MILAWGAVIVAAGRGTRFGRPKQLLPVAGKPLAAWSVSVFESMREIKEIVVVTEREWIEPMARVAVNSAVVVGGATRQASSYAGLRALRGRVDAVLVHDGARPLIEPEDVRKGMAAAGPRAAAVLGVPVVDTVKMVDGAGLVMQTLERGVLWSAQTPQFAMLTELLDAHEAGIHDGIDATDDAMLLERVGIPVRMVAGSPENFKVTLPADLTRAEMLLQARS